MVRLLGYYTAIAMAVGVTLASPLWAKDLPGKGVTVHPMRGELSNSWFEDEVVQIGLTKLGYTMGENKEADFPAVHLAVSSGDADYTAVSWKPLHDAYFEKTGGNSVMTRVHAIVTGASQGYYIDKKTADAHGITNIGQLKDPSIAALFDSNGDGKADLAGCNPGWGCEAVIEKGLDFYGLRKTVRDNQGSYFALMADVIARFKKGDSILYYTWTPNWISDVLVPGKDVTELQVPSSLPGTNTAGADGKNYGFGTNDIYILANNTFLAKNPAAKRFFELVTVPMADLNAAQRTQHDADAKNGGRDTEKEIRKLAEEWVAAHQAQFDQWIAEAVKAAG